jgi:hypothetical protein
MQPLVIRGRFDEDAHPTFGAGVSLVPVSEQIDGARLVMVTGIRGRIAWVESSGAYSRPIGVT